MASGIARMANKAFIALCIAAPAALTLVRPVFPHNVSVAAVFAITGLVLAVVLLGWSIWKLFSDHRHAGFGFVSVFVCFFFLVVVADYFAAHKRRQRQQSQAPTLHSSADDSAAMDQIRPHPGPLP